VVVCKVDAGAVLAFYVMARTLPNVVENGAGERAVGYMGAPFRMANRIPIELALARLAPILQLTSEKRPEWVDPYLGALPIENEPTIIVRAILRARFHPSAEHFRQCGRLNEPPIFHA
jgi:hypothetical protein